MANTVNWGVLSTAKIGREHVIPAMQKGKISRITAIASRDQASADRLAKELGIPRAYGSYEELLADPEIEAIYNPLPNHLHVPWTIRALEAGKHVLCEKPLALGLVEAQSMFDAAQRHRVMLLEAYPYYFQPQTGAMLALLREGAIGTVQSVQASFGSGVG